MRTRLSTRMKTKLDEIMDGACPECGAPAIEWDRSPSGYAYCIHKHGWKASTVIAPFMYLLDGKNGRVCRTVVGLKVTRKQPNEIIRYISDGSAENKWEVTNWLDGFGVE